MAVAGRELRPGVAYADDRPAVENMVGKPLILHPGPMNEAILVRAAVPVTASQFFFLVAHPSTPSTAIQRNGAIV